MVLGDNFGCGLLSSHGDVPLHAGGLLANQEKVAAADAEDNAGSCACQKRFDGIAQFLFQKPRPSLSFAGMVGSMAGVTRRLLCFGHGVLQTHPAACVQLRTSCILCANLFTNLIRNSRQESARLSPNRGFMLLGLYLYARMFRVLDFVCRG